MSALVVALLPNLVHGSGCHYGPALERQLFEAGDQGRVAQIYLWSTGVVQRVYEDGRFVYYQVPSEELPCRGPSCRGSDRENSMKAVFNVEPQRLIMEGQRLMSRFYPPDVSRPLLQCHHGFWVDPVLDGPLRPPC